MCRGKYEFKRLKCGQKNMAKLYRGVCGLYGRVGDDGIEFIDTQSKYLNADK
ncbi:hypothetical protein GCM10026988_30360 [Vibrio panuliri]